MRDAITTVVELLGAVLVAVSLVLIGVTLGGVWLFVALAATGVWFMACGVLFAPPPPADRDLTE